MTGKPKNQPRQISLPAPRPPRAMADIQAEYQQTALQAGQAQYQVFVHQEDVKNINKKLLELNREASVRNKLDAEAKKEGSNEQPA